MGLRIAQINAQKSAAATANLEKLMGERNIDILCIQEPYTCRGAIRGYTAQDMTIIQPGADRPWVAVVVANERLEFFHLAQYDTPHLVCLQVMSDREDFYIINIYCQFMLSFMDQIEKIINSLHSNNYIIAMDSNAKSNLWFANKTDERGRIVEDFLIDNKLHVVNTPSRAPTYLTTIGQSNIDVTFASETMRRKCTNWEVSDACTTSDHNLILFELRTDSALIRKFTKQENYNYIRRTNWKNFHQHLAEIKSTWQIRWTQEPHGRQLCDFIKDVDFVTCNEWFQPNRELIYLLTGNGPIRDTLFLRGLEEDDICPVCGKKMETVEYMIFDCEGYQPIRFRDLEKYKHSEKLIDEQDIFTIPKLC